MNVAILDPCFTLVLVMTTSLTRSLWQREIEHWPFYMIYLERDISSSNFLGVQGFEQFPLAQSCFVTIQVSYSLSSFLLSPFCLSRCPLCHCLFQIIQMTIIKSSVAPSQDNITCSLALGSIFRDQCRDSFAQWYNLDKASNGISECHHQSQLQ